MTSCFPLRAHWLALLGLAAFGAIRVNACGPDFPNAYLSNSFDEITTLPALSFERELQRLYPSTPGLSADIDANRLAEAERAEVREALARAGQSAADIDAALASYRRDEPPASLPTEFQLYARGARAWRHGDRDGAIAAWRALLALPPHERHYRTVWAAYMLGRAKCDTDPAGAIEILHSIAPGSTGTYADSQALTIAALGWLGRAFLNRADYADALRSYLRQFAAGDPTALGSIQLTLQKVFHTDRAVAPDATDHRDGCVGDDPAADADVRSLAEDAQLRPVVTAWFAARGGPSLPWSSEAKWQFARWIRCLPAIVNLTPEEADRWCWAAYQNGLWSEAGTLASHAPDGAPASEWVRAMLLLRSGLVGDAAVHLAKAAHGFSTDRALGADAPRDDDGANRRSIELQPFGDSPAAQLAGVRGVLALREENYTEALRVFLQADHDVDAAYVAERVLTVDELMAFVRDEVPTSPLRPADVGYGTELDLRWLLERRLARVGRFDEAAEFYPASVLSEFRRYVHAVRTGYDTRRPVGERAYALWLAAQIVHDHGMEIQGTELEPDFTRWDGAYTWPDLAISRGRGFGTVTGPTDPWNWRWRAQGDEGLGASADEFRRLKLAKVPAHRFHYRDRASALAWLAAGLLPNDDPFTAKVLNTAGGWIANRDPDMADQFYKSLVLRCPNTDLGRQAAAAHWLVRKSPQPDEARP